MKNSAYLLMVFYLFICLTGYGQNIPRTEQQIPVYPGSARNLDAQKQALKDYQEIYAGEPLRDLRVSVYDVKTILDDVCHFYIDKLGAKEGFPEDNNYSLYPKNDTNPWYEVGYFENSWFEDQYEGDIKIQNGKWFKAALSQRKPWVSGKWLQDAYFEWTVILDNGDWARHFIDINDESYDLRAKTVSTKTQIIIVSQIGKSDEALEGEDDEIIEETSKQRMNEFSKNPPTSSSLGIPFYPSWIFQAEQSAQMSVNDDYYYYIFTSQDEPQKVTVFFEQKLNKKSHDSGYGYIIALKGSLPIPEEGLTIQENTMYGLEGKTVITIQKQIQ